MREIKFRAWNKSEKIMCYDNEDDSSDYWDGCFSSDVGLINHRLSIKDKYAFMQYTGLKDKNDKEIYEGDILKTFNYEIDQMFNEGTENQNATQKKVDAYVVVEWSERNARFIMSKSSVVPVSFSHEVIGNIFENKELIPQ